jgi:hypothetical protein
MTILPRSMNFKILKQRVSLCWIFSFHEILGWWWWWCFHYLLKLVFLFFM